MRRRTLLAAGAAAAVAAAGAGAWTRRAEPPVRPSAPAGTEAVEQVHTAARGRGVDRDTAVPHGDGD
ncbi:esterase, partial [Actinoplanes sp. NPDC026623]